MLRFCNNCWPLRCFKKKIFFFLAALAFNKVNAQLQSCDSNYFLFDYAASDFVTFPKAVVTPDNSMLCLQANRLYFPGLTKFTPQGNVIFSYEYTSPYIANGNHSWTDLKFTDLAVASDTYNYISGSVTKHGVFFDNTEVPPARTAAVICKTDKYGKILWSRFFANETTDPLEFSNIITLKNGDVIGYLATETTYPFYGKVVCISADGVIKWTTILNTGSYGSGDIDFPKRAMLQASNGDIILADEVYYFAVTYYSSRDFHFLALDAATGNIKWEKSYDYGDANFIPDILSAQELPNGHFSFQTITNAKTTGNQTTATKELNIITDKNGNIKDLVATYPTNDFSYVIAAQPDGNSGDQNLLCGTSHNNFLLTQIDANGNIKWNRKYGKSDAGIPATSFVKIENGYNIFVSQLSRSFRMLRTDPVGKLDCDTLTVSMKQESLPAFDLDLNIHTQNLQGLNQGGYSTGFFVVENTVTTSIQKSTACQKNIPCCVDVVDTNHVNVIDLCEGASYKLPDNTIVQDSGKYYVLHKTLKGCDSVSLYKINIYKNPAALTLGLDTCFNGSDTIILHATDGYDQYIWTNDFVTPSSYFTVKNPGVYSVTVSNICGTKTDSVHIYDQCDFPVYMPNAFTPNGDRLNDVFKVPSQNFNRLVLLTIYNRWGKIIFQTTDINKGWDGNVNSLPQANGVYIYSLEMTNLIGKPISQKGTFTLIR